MQNWQTEIPNPFPYFLPIFFLLIAAEVYLAYRQNRELYTWKESLSSIWVGIGAALINTLTKVYQIAFFFLIYDLFAPLRHTYLGHQSLGWGWWVWGLCLLGDDFNFYWHHRFCHNVRLLWAAHLVHHSSEKFNLVSGFRNGWTIFFFKPLYWLWLPMVGFHPVMVGLCMSVSSIYQFFLHSTYVPKLGWVGKVFNTPWDHQVHHACNIAYLDKNHGGMLIIWDRLFGTFQDNRPDTPPKFGVLHPPHQHDPLTLNFYEFANIWQDVKRSRSWKERFKYLFYSPGWSPDGSRKTARQLQEELKDSPARREIEAIYR